MEKEEFYRKFGIKLDDEQMRKTEEFYRKWGIKLEDIKETEKLNLKFWDYNVLKGSNIQEAYDGIAWLLITILVVLLIGTIFG